MPTRNDVRTHRAADPPLRRIGLSDVSAILRAGIRDFSRAPAVAVAIALTYTLGGWLLAALLLVFKLPFLIYPTAMGFALVAPFVAVAFYDVSRSLTAGEQPTLAKAWSAACAARNRDVRWMALITGFAFFLWMDIAAMITLSFFGAAALDMAELLHQIRTTQSGLVFLVVGHLIGAVIAALIFSVSAISIPMLYDRDIDVVTAMRTSVRLVTENPIPMGAWCVLIAASMVLAIATGLLLLPVILPILGFASWHLYVRAVGTSSAE